MTIKISAEQILCEARDFLSDANNWFKGSYTNGDGAYCAIGATCEAMAHHGIDNLRFRPDSPTYILDGIVKRLRPEFTGENMRAAAEFNDYPATTHAELLRMFDEAIKFCKENGL